MAQDDYAIVVGISSYPYLEDLGGPVHDARAMAAWLADRDGGDVPAERVCSVLSPEVRPPAARPVRDEILQEFDKIHPLAEAGGGHVGRRLYLYFAGHGIGPGIEEAALLMANASRLITGYNVPGREYANWFRRVAWFDEVVLFMDCCREDRKLAPITKVHYEPLDSLDGRVALHTYAFATQPGRAAREVDVPHPKHGTWSRGIFTLSLLDGLSGAAATGGTVTSESLKNYVLNDITRRARDLGAEDSQQPAFDYDASIVFRANAATTATIVADVAAGVSPGDVSLADGRLVEVPPFARAEGRVEWRVPPGGIYRVRVGPKVQYVEALAAGGTYRV